jgi:hypothetical protein
MFYPYVLTKTYGLENTEELQPASTTISIEAQRKTRNAIIANHIR